MNRYYCKNGKNILGQKQNKASFKKPFEMHFLKTSPPFLPWLTE